MHGWTRRRLLATAAAAGIGGVAGCSDVPGLDSETDDDGFPSPPLATYDDWLVAPSAFDLESPPYQIEAARPAEVLAHEDDLAASVEDFRWNNTDGIEGSDIELQLLVFMGASENGFVVIEGSYDRAVMQDALTENELVDEGAYEGYDLFTDTALGSPALAFGDDVLLVAGAEAGGDPLGATKSLIDCALGRGPHVRDELDGADAVVDGLGGGSVVNATVGGAEQPFEGAIASGYSLAVDAEATDLRAAVVYEAAEAADTAAISNTLSETDLLAADDVRTHLDGRTVLGLGSATTSEVASLTLDHWDGSSEEPVQPAVNFSFEWAEESTGGTLTITHNSGDSIKAAELFIRGTGLADTGRWNSLGGSASGDIDGEPAVVAGNHVEVGADSAYDVRVVWEDSEGDSSATLAEDHGPDA